MRVDYADGIVAWRHGPAIKIVWVVCIVAWTVAVVIGSGLDLGDRVFLLLLAVLAAAVAWARVWRPQLAATPDGLVVRRAWSAILVPWANISAVSRPTIYGLTIRVRVGSHVRSAMPAKGPIAMLLNLDSEADQAAQYIEERAREATASTVDR